MHAILITPYMPNECGQALIIIGLCAAHCSACWGPASDPLYSLARLLPSTRL